MTEHRNLCRNCGFPITLKDGRWSHDDGSKREHYAWPMDTKFTEADEVLIRTMIKPLVLEMHRRGLTLMMIMKDGANVHLSAY